MTEIYTTRYCAVSDTLAFCERFLDFPDWIDRMVDELCAVLHIVIPVNTRAPLLISDGNMSEVRGGQIVIVPKEDDRCTAHDWFELLFRHEFTHWLAMEFWGTSVVLFWEGLPIYLADNRVRQRIFGFSYHQFCAALLARYVLLPLHSIVLPDRHYGMSHDFRVAAQSGSFTGYLIETYGMKTLEKAYRTYTTPTPQSPQLLLTQLFTSVWQKSLTELEESWRVWLRHNVERHDEAELMAEKCRYPNVIDLQAVHCKFCCTPMSNGKVCLACGADQQIEIAVV